MNASARRRRSGSAFSVETRVERAARDALGGVGNGSERADQPAGRDAPDPRGGDPGRRNPGDQRTGQHFESPVQLIEWVQLEVGAARGSHGNPDRQAKLAVGVVVPLMTGMPVSHQSEEVSRDRVWSAVH